MKNINFMPEIASAHQFIIDHNYNEELRTFLYEMTYNTDEWSHSDRWPRIYDWMQEHYPEATGSLITGLTYYVEG